MHDYLIDRLPSRSSIRRTWVYAWLGETLLDSRLWDPSRHSLALGLGAGWCIGLLPFFGLQGRVALLVGALLRCHLPSVALGALVSNPMTIPALIALQYLFGCWLLDATALNLSPGLAEASWLVRAATPFLSGAIVSAVLAGPVGYGLAWMVGNSIAWRKLGKVV